jgi:hypothetical protein
MMIVEGRCISLSMSGFTREVGDDDDDVFRRKREPWYHPPLTDRQLAIEKVMIKLGLRNAKHSPGPRYQCEGYRMQELVSNVTYVSFPSV